MDKETKDGLTYIIVVSLMVLGAGFAGFLIGSDNGNSELLQKIDDMQLMIHGQFNNLVFRTECW